MIVPTWRGGASPPFREIIGGIFRDPTTTGHHAKSPHSTAMQLLTHTLSYDVKHILAESGISFKTGSNSLQAFLCTGGAREK